MSTHQDVFWALSSSAIANCCHTPKCLFSAIFVWTRVSVNRKIKILRRLVKRTTATKLGRWLEFKREKIVQQTRFTNRHIAKTPNWEKAKSWMEDRCSLGQMLTLIGAFFNWAVAVASLTSSLAPSYFLPFISHPPLPSSLSLLTI